MILRHGLAVEKQQHDVDFLWTDWIYIAKMRSCSHITSNIHTSYPSAVAWKFADG
jgi:hypothetical protein